MSNKDDMNMQSKGVSNVNPYSDVTRPKKVAQTLPIGVHLSELVYSYFILNSKSWVKLRIEEELATTAMVAEEPNVCM